MIGSCLRRLFAGSAPPIWSSQLFGLGPRDPLTFIGSAIALTFGAGLAGFLPALRASGVDPTTALGHE